jgi:site-specific DNA-methyltransferase (adenine-specific)
MTQKLNRVIAGDCLEVLKKIPSNSVDLVYLDPPFFTQREHVLSTRDGAKDFNFSDCWKDLSEYTDSIQQRVAECRRVLKNSGSLFLHCDKSASHYLKVALDKVFGAENFQSEIVWTYRRWSNSKKGLLNNHQIIFFYSKTSAFKFNQMFDSYSPATNVEQIVQLRSRDSRNKSVYKKNADGSAVLCSAKNGVPLGDVWDIPFLNPKAKERVGYPTQKPVLLLERIIQLITSPGDTVLDPYCGSGTTLVAARLCGRNFLGIDINADAVSLAEERLKAPFKSESQLLKKGRASYLRAHAGVAEVLKNLKATPVQRSSGIDGLLSVNNQMVPFKIVFDSDLAGAAEKLHKASKKNKFAKRALYVGKKMAPAKAARFEKEHGILIFNSLEELNDKIRS